MPYPYSWKPSRLTPTLASQVKVLNDAGQAAALTTPVSVTTGTISFALTNTGRYHILVKVGTQKETGTFNVDATGVDIKDPEYGSFEPYSPADASTQSAPTASAVTLSQLQDPNSAVVAALNATYTPAVENTVIIFGDSLTAQNGGGADTLDPADAPAAVDARGYWHWANFFMGQKAKLVRNAGVGGNTSAGMLARIQTDVLAYPSGWVVLCAGANDVAQDRTLSAIQADMTSILDQLTAAGRKVVLTTTPPSSSYTTTARLDVLGKLNAWISGLPSTRPNVVVADIWRTIADPATGYPATGMVTDLVHWSMQGAMRIGRAVADAMGPHLLSMPNRVIGLVDPNNTIGNPHMASGTGWATVGTGFTAAYSLDTASFRNKAVLTFTAATGAEDTGIQFIEPIANGRYVAGDVVQLSARLKWANATFSPTGKSFYPWLRIMARKADNSFGASALAMQTASNNSVNNVGLPVSGEGVAITHRLTLTSNIANLYVAVGWAGMLTGTLEISELSIWKNA